MRFSVALFVDEEYKISSLESGVVSLIPTFPSLDIRSLSAGVPPVPNVIYSDPFIRIFQLLPFTDSILPVALLSPNEIELRALDDPA